MPVKKSFLLFLGIYALLRAFSYFFSPETPLYQANPINTFIATLILCATIYFLLKKDPRGWIIIAGEIILGGGGNYLAVGPLSLRTSLLICSLLIFAIQQLSFRPTSLGRGAEESLNVQLKKTWPALLLIVVALFAAGRGLYFGHAPRQIFSDIIPYFFLLYIFPLRDLLQSDRFKSVCEQALFAAVIGNALFIFLTYTGFSGGLFALQGEYYHWFRDVALGKITELGFNSFRVILDEHLLLIPLLLAFLYKIIKEKLIIGHWGLVISLLFILSTNITRIYILALAVGLLLLFSKTNWKRWLIVSTASLALFFLLFTSLHLASSRGQNLGWEIFGLRLQSVAAPRIEESSLSRVLLLPKIWEKIKAHPLLGNGLGDTVTVYSPVLKQTITTPHFDWGYLEIWAETGIVGLVVWLFIFAAAFKSQLLPAAPLASLLIINLTSPAVFHVLGIILIAYYFTHSYVASQNSH